MAEWRPPSLSPAAGRALGAWRAALRASPAKRVAIFLEHRERFVGAVLAAWAEGREVVLPGDALPATVQALRPSVDAFLGDFPGVQTLAPGPDAEAAAPTLEPLACALTLFTSGSTGAPVALPRRLAQLLAEVTALEATFGAELPLWARVYSTVSHQHLYGLLFAVLWPLSTGRLLTAERLEYPEALRAEVEAHDAILVTSPAHLRRLPEGEPWRTRLHAVFSSGGPLGEEAARHAEALWGHAPREVYGSSETGGIAWRTWRRPAWTPLPGVGWRLTPDGRLEVQSPFLASQAWHLTEDRAQAAGDTFLLLGRADRVVKVEEKRVSLEAVERALLRSGLCGQARALLLEGRRGELGVACTLTAEGEALEARGRRTLVEALRSSLVDVVERVAVPRRFRFLDALPVNEQGKVTQRALEWLFAPERPSVTWRERGAERAVLDFVVSEGLRVLDGHFPQHPIVPGVAQLDWAVTFGQQAFPLPPNLVHMDAVKFQALMRPGDAVTLELTWSTQKSTLGFAFTGGDRRYSSGRIALAGPTRG